MLGFAGTVVGNQWLQALTPIGIFSMIVAVLPSDRKVIRAIIWLNIIMLLFFVPFFIYITIRCGVWRVGVHAMCVVRGVCGV